MYWLPAAPTAELPTVVGELGKCGVMQCTWYTVGWERGGWGEEWRGGEGGLGLRSTVPKQGTKATDRNAVIRQCQKSRLHPAPCVHIF